MHWLYMQRISGWAIVHLLVIGAMAQPSPAEEDVTAPLIKQLKSGDVDAQIHALAALERLGKKAAPAAPQVVALLRARSFKTTEDHYRLSYEAEDVLLNIGPDALPVLAASAGQAHTRHGAATHVIDAMLEFEETARPWILPLLRHKDVRIQIATLDLIGKRRRRSEPWFPQILATLQATEISSVQIAAARSMEKIAQYARQPVQEQFSRQASAHLLKLAAAENPQVALAAAAALVRIEDGRHNNGKLEVLSPHLLSLLKNDDPLIRIYAARYLRLTKLATAAVVDALIDAMLEDKNPLVRMMAAEALNGNAYKQKKVIAAMAEVIGVNEEPVETPPGISARGVAVTASLTLQNNHRASLPYLKANLTSADETTRYRSARLIAHIQPGFGTAQVRGILLSRLDDAQPLARYNALQDIGRLGPLAAPAVAEITVMLKDHAVAIESQSPMATMHVHDAAAYALREIGPAAKSATPALAASISGGEISNPHSLRQLYTALKKIDPQHPLTDHSFIVAEAAGVMNYFLKGRFQTALKTELSERTTVIEFQPFQKQSNYKTTSPVIISTTTEGMPVTTVRQQRIWQLHQKGGVVLLTETMVDPSGETVSQTTAEFHRHNYGVSLSLSEAAREAAQPGDWISWDWQPMKAGLRGFQKRKGQEEATIWRKMYPG